ncbi:ribonuclease H-like domain-containing protein [Tanacetum coccineum]
MNTTTLFLLAFILFFALSANSAPSPNPVLDAYGKNLQTGVAYYVMPAPSDRERGGLFFAAVGNFTCPAGVAQGRTDGAYGDPLIFTRQPQESVEGNPGPETLDNWFEIEKTKDGAIYRTENTVEDRIMDSGASFHSTYCKGEFERFKLRSGKVRLADDKTLDIASVGDVVLKTYFGTSWTLKDVSSVAPETLGDMSRIGMSMLASKGNVPDVRKVDIYFCKPGGLGIMSVKTRKLQSRSWGRYNANLQVKCLKFDNGGEYSSLPIKFCVENGIVILKMVPETPLQFGVAERLSRTFRADSTGIRAEASKILWADSALAQMKCDTAFGIRRVTRLSEAEILHLWTRFMKPGGSSNTSEGSENSGSFKDSGRSDKEYSKDRVSYKEGGSETPQVQRSTRESRALVRYSPSANYLLLTENGEPDSYSEVLSSKESVQWKKAIIEEMVSLKMKEACSLVRLPTGKKALQSMWIFKVKKEHNDSEKEPSYVGALNDTSTQHKSEGFQLAGQEENLECRLKEILYGLIQAPMLRYLKFDSFMQKDKVDDMLVAVPDMAEFNKPKWQLPLVFEMKDKCSEKQNEEPYSDVHQVGDEREVEVLRSFNWSPSELITEDDVLPERGYSQFNDRVPYVWWYRKVRAVALLKGRSRPMDLESTQNNALAKLPLLKQGDYDTWRLRIESYIQLQDYALWEIIEDGNSFKPVARTTTNADDTSTSTIPGAVTAEEDSKILLKQMYENFNASSSESLNFIFTRLQKINVAFVSTPGSTNDVNTSNVHVSTASSSLSVSSTTDNTARLSDATIYAFLANQPNGSQVVHEDLEQIHEDDLEEMDLKWQLALLSMKARKFYQRTGKKIVINGIDTAGYDKTKVECFNFHKMGHFSRECKNPRSQENRSRNQDSSRRTMNVEETSSKAMLAIDGVGFDWSFMSEEKTPTNFALMAFSDSEVHNNKTCSKICLKSFEDLKSQYDNLRIELNKSEFDLANYKRDASFNESEINALKIQIERLKKEKESNQIKIDNFENASKSLDKLIGCQISDNNRKGVGYNAVPPPPTGLFAPPTIDLSNSGLEEFKQPEFEGYGVKVNKSVSENSSNEIKKTSGAPIIEDWVSDCDEDETVEKVSESANVQKPKQADQPRKVSQNPRNNSTNWNTPMSKKLGVGFQFTPKACFVCGSFNHLIKDCDFHDKKMVQKPVLNNEKRGTGQREVRPVWNNAMRTNHQNFSNSRRNFAPTAVLTKSGLVPISAARQNSSRTAATVSAARPIKTAAPKPFVNVAKARLNAFQKSHSPSRRPFYQQTALKSINLNNKVNTVKTNSVNTAKGKRVTSAVGEQGIDVVKSKACWVWRPRLKGEDIEVSMNILSVLVVYHTKNGHQFTMSNRHQELASPEKTVSGKDFSNPLIVDSLLKTIWFINAPCFCNEALAIPGQTATVKEFSNPLMVDSLPKTILSTKLLG